MAAIPDRYGVWTTRSQRNDPEKKPGKLEPNVTISTVLLCYGAADRHRGSSLTHYEAPLMAFILHVTVTPCLQHTGISTMASLS
jgi:hypothetical protein